MNHKLNAAQLHQKANVLPAVHAVSSAMSLQARFLSTGFLGALLSVSAAGAVSIQASGILPDGPASEVSVRADGAQVAVTTADRVGLFTPQGQRQALVSPTGRLLVDVVYSGNDLFTLDTTGTLAQVSGKQTKVVGQALCGNLKGSEGPHLAASGSTLTVACPHTLLVGQPGQWQRIDLPTLPDGYGAGQVAVSPTANEVAVIRASQILRFHLPDMKPLPTITRLPGEDTSFMDDPVKPASASAVAYDASGQRLAVGWNMSFPKAYNQSVTVYDLKSGTGRSLPTYADNTRKLAFSTDGKFLLADGFSTPRLWNLTDRKRLAPPQPTNTGIGVQGVAWLGQNIISTSSLGALALTPQGQQVAKFQMPLAHVNLLTVSDNGRWVAAAGEGRQLNLFDLKAGQAIWSVKAHPYQVGSLKFNRAGTLLVSGDANSEFVRFWDVKTGKAVGPSVTGIHSISGFTPGDKEVVLGGRIVPVAPLLRRQGELFLGNLPGQTYRKSVSETSQLTPDGKSMCETQLIFRDRGMGFRASSWQLGALEKNNFGLSLPEERRLGATSADCRVLAVAAIDVIGKEHTYHPLGVEVYDPATGKKIQMWPSGNRVESLAVSSDGRRVAWLEDGRAELLIGDVKTGKQVVWKLPAVVQDMDTVPLAFRADGKALLVGVGSQSETSFTVLNIP
ncbi:hypothetical protein GCM10008959_41030 [Deinococcus seoulensis]|uniref:WD40 repeat domain-containing protein n=1 Tax=Deinococcus seoulensis TaxID=1837379 RepID=A0ABQ2S1D3_9DEIO|nr:WD40 repeat domain-containing protein [Deinococcus seoulensis]GGR75881.1 hypothetical protein GCM10008959_41030 [Deinococcus seoulensis]